MTVLRWAAGILAAALAIGALFGFAISVAFDNDIWARRARRFGSWLWMLALFWFNCEIWGRVVYTLVNWGGA